MITQDTLINVIREQKRTLPDIQSAIKRELTTSVNISSNHAIIITGIRRCGKSTLLKLLAMTFPAHHYLNFEDTRLIDFEKSDFAKLQEVFEHDSPEIPVYIFDEIQIIEKWEIFIRQLLDNGKKIFITGSNASLLSRELGTRLTGRHLSYTLFPFSFLEYSQIQNQDTSFELFESYFKSGGFPEFIKTPDIQILQNLVNDVLLRDIVVRYNIRNATSLQKIAFFLLSNVGKEFSFTGLCKIFEITSVNTLISFIKYLEDSYLVFTLPKFDYSLKKQSVNPKKIYGIDHGLIRANSMSFSADEGRLLENIVYIHLKRLNLNVWYFKQKRECDFVAGEQQIISLAIQVCYKLNEDNKTREIQGIVEAAKYFKLTEGLILTYNQTDFFEIEGTKITVMPVWKWMINSKYS